MSTIALSEPDTAGYVPDLSMIATWDNENSCIYRHKKGGYYVIIGFSFDAQDDRWRYEYMDAYLYRDIMQKKAKPITGMTAPFNRTPENFHELVPNDSPRSLEQNRGLTHVPRFLLTPFTFKTLPDNKTLFD
jgi:hypothetical protein